MRLFVHTAFPRLAIFEAWRTLPIRANAHLTTSYNVLLRFGTDLDRNGSENDHAGREIGCKTDLRTERTIVYSKS